jgi:hypothetical protein
MDLEYNAKLEAIMKRHNTDVWNDDCANDPEYSSQFVGYSEDAELPQPIQREAISHTGKNRSQRRAEARANDKPVHNNRKQTKARKGNKLYLKMAAFAMSVTDQRMKAKYGY